MSRRTCIPAALLAVLLTVVAPVMARGIEGKEAPRWGVEQWINLPEGVKALDVDHYRGKVLYLYFFQSWCPGCHSRGFPTLKELIKDFAGAQDVAFVAVQTTFEGFDTNTTDAAWRTARRYDLKIPVGQSGAKGKRSPLMARYRTGGTPWTVIIDKEGKVVFNDFHLTPSRGRALIERLRATPAAKQKPRSIKTLPAARGGQDLVGTRFPKLQLTRRVGKQDQPADPAEPPRATLYRWWTDQCPYCASSLPALEQLRTRYADRGLAVVGVYHPKPPRAVTDDFVAAAARRLGFGGVVLVDEDWSQFRRVYPPAEDRRATSVSFLVDQGGVIRFVHPGPDLYRSDDPEHSRQDGDYRLLEAAIQVMLE